MDNATQKGMLHFIGIPFPSTDDDDSPEDSAHLEREAVGGFRNPGLDGA